jgi:hypothetical protein
MSATAFFGAYMDPIAAGTPGLRTTAPPQPPNSYSLALSPFKTSVSLGAFEFIQHTYKCPEWGDEDAYRLIAHGMLCFALRDRDPVYDTTTIVTLAKLNQIAYDEYRVYEEQRLERGSEAEEFHTLLVKHGEEAIEAYHRFVRSGKRAEDVADPVLKPLLQGDYAKMYEMAQRDTLCWVTRFGIMTKVNFLGSVINTSRNVGYNDENTFDQYAIVNVCLAKRFEVLNVFGEQVGAGTKVWLALTRKPERGNRPGPFQVVPGASMETRPAGLQYRDESGRYVSGWLWRVGVVLQPGKSNPTGESIRAAANISYQANERRAYEAFQSLPSLYVALGYK